MKIQKKYYRSTVIVVWKSTLLIKAGTKSKKLTWGVCVLFLEKDFFFLFKQSSLKMYMCLLQG